MVIREGYRTSIDHPFDSSKGRLDGYPGRLPNKYSPPFDSFKGRPDGHPGSLPNNTNIGDKPRAPRGCLLVESLHSIQTYT